VAKRSGPRGTGTGEAADQASVDVVFKALADPHRRQILRLVQHHELPAGEIAAQFAMTQQAVSLHLTVLKRAGLLTDRSEGTRRLYQLRHDALRPARAVLDEFWPTALGRLKQAVETDHPRARTTRDKESR
jgi:DNA-binding transcriptional ArsR family regulator